MRVSSQILTVAEMVAAEQALIAAGTSVDALMLRAGRGAADWVWRLSGGRAVTVLCGPGNNGGDGYVIAETLRARGSAVTVIVAMEPATEAARHARAGYAGPVLDPSARPHGDVLVDCLFGSGLSRPLTPQLLALLQELAGRHHHSVAVDMPSGLDSDSGRPLNQGLPRFDLTLALGAWKYAHWLMPGAALMGERRLVPIGVAEGRGRAELLVQPLLAAPAPDAHKYTRGLAVTICGAMPGAALLACKAAMHGGAGYGKLLADVAPAAAPAELVIDTRPLDEALGDRRISAALVGPGLGRDEAAQARLIAVLGRDCPTVLDADALMLLKPAMLAGRSAQLVATPHEGELAALCAAFGIAAEGKLARASALASAVGIVVVAKGPDTVIASPDGRIALAPPASSWLSVAGTGDVLAGILLSRLASGASAMAAACEAVWLHGEAARLSGPAFTAGELAGRVAQAYAACL